jgi:hypothetical protein
LQTAKELCEYIEKRKSSKVFAGWSITERSHRNDIVVKYLTGLLFFSRDARTQAINGLGLVEPLQQSKNEFFINQLVADNKQARIDVIQQFINKYPDAIVSKYDRKSRRVNVKDSAKLLKRILK